MHCRPVLDTTLNLSTGLIDTSLAKADFPVFDRYPDLHYLDSAATSQKPRCVIDAITASYEYECAPINRGLYSLAADATQKFEHARESIARLINAPDSDQCVFTRSATESINLIAFGWARSHLSAGDEVWVSAMEHHANYLPWQRVCFDTGAILRVLPVSKTGELVLDEQSLFSQNVKLIALTHVSNVLGTINPVASIISKARKHGIPILLDACQSVGHMPVDVQVLDCDFLVFSAHKMYGPDGIGVLYAKQALLEQCEPLLLGGGMVDKLLIDSNTPVASQSNIWSGLPQKLEAGSPNFTGAVGMAAAADYVQRIGLDKVHRHVSTLANHTKALLSEIECVHVLAMPAGSAALSEPSSGVISFIVEGVHPHDVAQVLADNNVAIRAGHHCAQPLMHALDISSTARASFAIYNTADDVAALVAAVETVVSMFGRKRS